MATEKVGSPRIERKHQVRHHTYIRPMGTRRDTMDAPMPRFDHRVQRKQGLVGNASQALPVDLNSIVPF
jgi:hypothetical protein